MTGTSLNTTADYSNGNYRVKIYSDGSKIRFTSAAKFEPEFPESIDLKITNMCHNRCEYCYEKSHPGGRHGSLRLAFFDTLGPGTELAIGGGNPWLHPGLMEFLKKMRKKNIICSMTLHHADFLQHYKYLSRMRENGLIHGVGVSLNNVAVGLPDRFPGMIIHVIAGVMPVDKLARYDGQNFKLLILGYKRFGRGLHFEVCENQVIESINNMRRNLKKIMGWFDLVCFDNLALKQLHVRDCLPSSVWDKYFMGEDGEFTMYVDAIGRRFAVSSTSMERFAIRSDIRKMFMTVRSHR